MNTRKWAILIAVGAIAYMLLMGWQGLRFIASGDPLAMAMGFAVLVLPLLGLWMVWRELQFAGQVEKMADRLASAAALPPDLPRTPAGRVQPEAAAEEFTTAVAEVAVAPRDPAAWFRLSLAYDAGRDRKRARAAMRYAVALDNGTAPAELPERLRPPQ